ALLYLSLYRRDGPPGSGGGRRAVLASLSRDRRIVDAVPGERLLGSIDVADERLIRITPPLHTAGNNNRTARVLRHVVEDRVLAHTEACNRQCKLQARSLTVERLVLRDVRCVEHAALAPRTCR